MRRNSQLNICFLYQGVPCDGNTPTQKPLGGTESAMIFMARALSERDHEVHVFTNTPKKAMYDGVDYHPYGDFEAYALEHGLENGIDVLISIRQLLPLLSRRWARAQFYLSPDAYDQPALHSSLNIRVEAPSQSFDVGLFSLKYVKNFIDGIICVGQWQARTFMSKFGVPEKNIFIGHNGVALDFFPKPAPLDARKKQIVYASTPFRGLKELLMIFPKIKERVPTATCAVLSGMQTYGASEEQDQKEYKDVYQLAHQPGVKLYGPLAKKEMVEIFEESRVLAYPNTFTETFCISALEAQAAGLPVVTTNLAGLKERVTHEEDGFLINGHPLEKDYQEKFVDSVVACLTQDSLWEKQSQASYLKALDYSYEKLAEKWEEYFCEKLENENAAYFFLPHDEKLSLMINGYPKHIELKKDFLCRSYAQKLYESGYQQTAKQVLDVLEK